MGAHRPEDQLTQRGLVGGVAKDVNYRDAEIPTIWTIIN